MLKRVGIFICWCGSNIAGTINISKVLKELAKHENVACCADYKYMCSDPGQNMIKKAIKEKRLTRIVVAACTPTLHENTFRRVAEVAGLNPYLCEIANIREQCSWVHDDKEIGTEKAIRIIKCALEKVLLNEPLKPIISRVTRKVLVIGGGIAGIQAALDIANAGHEVLLVEKSPSIGGRMAQLAETFPTLDCAQCILTPKMVELAQNPKVRLLTYSEIEDFSGSVGNFKVRIRKKAKFVDFDKCIGCGICTEKCPRKVSAEFDLGLSFRKAIYMPFKQAIPPKVVIDKKNCLYFKTGKCKVCAKVCPTGAIDFKQKDSYLEERVGAVIVATGFELYEKEKKGEYSSGKDVIDSLQFERLLSAMGPTNGEIRRPSDGKVPKQIVFIQCVGSRDPEKGVPYCSKVCCMYTAKHAMLYKRRVPDGQAYVFYLDIRSGGKGYEEFVQKVIEEDKVLYLRGKVSRIFQEGEKIVVFGVDTLSGKKVEILADLVVLVPAMLPSPGIKELAKKLKISADQFGFLSEAHPKLRPVEALKPGIYLAGCAQGPKDIPESIAQASAAASKACTLLSAKKFLHEPMIVEINEDYCSKCCICIKICPFAALSIAKEKIKLDEKLCGGCGICVSACPAGAIQLKNLNDDQIFKMIDLAVS